MNVLFYLFSYFPYRPKEEELVTDLLKESGESESAPLCNSKYLLQALDRGQRLDTVSGEQGVP